MREMSLALSLLGWVVDCKSTSQVILTVYDSRDIKTKTPTTLGELFAFSSKHTTNLLELIGNRLASRLDALFLRHCFVACGNGRGRRSSRGWRIFVFRKFHLENDCSRFKTFELPKRSSTETFPVTVCPLLTSSYPDNFHVKYESGSRRDFRA